MSSDALVILPGITASPAKQAAVASFLRARLDCETHVPPLWQCLGIRGAARQLSRYLDRQVLPARPGRIHVLCYISGGFILREVLAERPLEGLGHVVHVRGPLQEQVPGRFIRQRGRLPAFLARGRMLFDLAAPWKDALPFVRTGGRQGLVLERGVSALARQLGLEAGDFEALRADPAFVLPPADAVLEAQESHDDVYTSEPLLGRIATFLQTGDFHLGSTGPC